MARPIKVTILGDVSDLSDKLDRGGKAVGGFGVQLDGLGKTVAGMAAKVGLLGAAVGGIGDTLAEGLNQAAIKDKLAAQLGATGDEAQRLGGVAGRLYAQGYGEGLQDVADSVKSVVRNISGMGDASTEELERIAAKTSSTASVFDQELGGVTRAVGNMLRNGLAADADEAFDILTRGFQTGADKAGDLLDTFNEYGTQFRDLGLDGKTAMGLLSQGLQAGARDADIVADAFKEFAIRAKDGSKTTADGFKAIGLDYKEMGQVFARGGPPAAAALDTVLDRLGKIPDPVKRSQTAVALFGTQAEDLQQALFALNPSDAVAALGKIEGAADSAGDTFHDNAQTRLAAFWRGLQTGAIEIIGGKLLPALERMAEWVRRNETPIKIVAGVVTALMIPALVRWAVTSTTTAATVVGTWVATKAAAIGSIATQVAGLFAMVARFAWAGAQALFHAAKIAAAWVLAMGPIGWVIAAVVGLVALIVANWETVKEWTAAAWDWVVNAVKTAVNWLLNLFLNWTLPGLIIKHWDTIVNAITTALQWISDRISGAWNWITSTVRGAVDAVSGAVGRGFDWVVSKVRSAIDTAVSIIHNVWGGIVGFFAGIGEGVKSAIGSAFDWVVEKVRSVINWVRDRINDVGNFISQLNPFRASGGAIAVTGSYTVGERGPETVVLPKGSKVVPNHMGGGSGGGGSTVNVHVSTNADPYAIGAAVAWSLRNGGR